MTFLDVRIAGVDLAVEGWYVYGPHDSQDYFEWERVEVLGSDQDITQLLIYLNVDLVDKYIQDVAFKQQVEEE